MCSSGLCCAVYDGCEISASTVHLYYRLQTGDLPWVNVAKQSCSNNLVMQRLQAIHAVIWDKASMSSQRISELANAIHHKALPNENIYNPFAGKQIIVVGEFLQLCPVPNEFDGGKFMFMSSVFQACIPHWLHLTKLM